MNNSIRVYYNGELLIEVIKLQSETVQEAIARVKNNLVIIPARKE